MADETTAPKTPEQKAENVNKKELRRLKNDMKVAREKAKELGEERKKLEASYNALAAQMGLPARGKKASTGE